MGQAPCYTGGSSMQAAMLTTQHTEASLCVFVEGCCNTAATHPPEQLPNSLPPTPP